MKFKLLNKPFKVKVCSTFSCVFGSIINKLLIISKRVICKHENRLNESGEEGGRGKEEFLLIKREKFYFIYSILLFREF